MKKYCLFFLLFIGGTHFLGAQNGISNAVTFNYNPSIFTTNIFKQKGWSVFGEYNKGVGYKLDNANFSRYSANFYGKYIFSGGQNIFRYKRRFFPGLMLGCSSQRWGGLFQSTNLMGSFGFRVNLNHSRSEYEYVAMALTGMYRMDQMSGFNIQDLNLVHPDDPLLQGDLKLKMNIFQPRLNAEWSQLLGEGLVSASVCYSPMDFKDGQQVVSNGVSAKVVFHRVLRKNSSLDQEKYIQTGSGNTWSVGYSNWNNDQMALMQFEFTPILFGRPEYKVQNMLTSKTISNEKKIEQVDSKLDESGLKNESLRSVLGRFNGQNISMGINLGYRFGNSTNPSACFFVRWNLANYDRKEKYSNDTHTALMGYSQSFGNFQNVGGVSTYMYEYSSEQLTKDCEILGGDFQAKMNSFTKGNEEEMRFLYTQLSNCPCYEQYSGREKCELAREKFEVKKVVEEKEEEVTEIGKNKWTRNNLKLKGLGSTKFKLATSAEDWIRLCDSRTPAYCYPDWSDKEADKKGYLYNKFAMEAIQNNENYQYRIPTIQEWNELFKKTHEDIPFPCLSKSSDCLDMCNQKFVDFNLGKDGMVAKWSEQDEECLFDKKRTAFWINQKSDKSIVYFKECIRDDSFYELDPNYIGAYIRLIKK
jgi:uncharacterized protein (TIGR02145 family)